MSMHMGDHSDHSDDTIAGLRLSDPQCNSDSCTAFYAAHDASQHESRGPDHSSTAIGPPGSI